MFEKYTERARQVVVLAQDEARALKYPYVGSEHILLGLIREEEGIAARVLGNLDIVLEVIRADVGAMEDGAVVTGQMLMTPGAKKVMEMALREALSLGHNYIGTEHILLGLMRVGDDFPHRGKSILEKYATSEAVKLEVIRLLTGPGKKKVAKEREVAKVALTVIRHKESDPLPPIHHLFQDVTNWGVTDDDRFLSIYHKDGRDLIRIDLVERVEERNG